jgi:hypothetical protein
VWKLNHSGTHRSLFFDVALLDVALLDWALFERVFCSGFVCFFFRSTGPDGAFCGGDNITWSHVKALWGWWRISSGDKSGGGGETSTIRSNFTKCIYPPACLGAPNPAMVNRFFNASVGQGEDKIDLAIHAYPGGNNESCFGAIGHRETCQEGGTGGIRCRLCHTCRSNYEHGTQGECKECSNAESNRYLLAGGALFVFLAASVLVKMQIDNQGKGGLSDAVKKVLLNYLQMAALAQQFPLQVRESLYTKHVLVMLVV